MTPGPPWSRRQVLGLAAGATATGLVACTTDPPKLGPEPPPATAPPDDPDAAVAGDGAFTDDSQDITVVDAGGWCWFSDQRALFDDSLRLTVGSVANGTGTERDGAVEVTTLAPREDEDDEGGGRTQVLADITPADDHNNPGLVRLADGGLLAMWTAHAGEPRIRWAVARGDSRRLEVQPPIERPATGTPPAINCTYASVHRLDDEDVILCAYRGEGFTWNLLRSDDDATTWEPMGTVVVPPASGQRPYARFSSDGSSLWFATTEGHPGSYERTGVRVGRIAVDGTISDAAGNAIGAVGPGVPVLDVPLAHQPPADQDAWVSDVRVILGRPVVALSVRTPPTDPAAGAFGHEYWRATADQFGVWSSEMVGHGGGELQADEVDYSGLAALVPDDPDRLVLSTNVDPSTGDALVSADDDRPHFQLFRADRTTTGTWQHTALTADGTEDHVRPVVVQSLGGTATVLLWMQGAYGSYTTFRTRIQARLLQG